jgi:hypothetical protein
VVLALLLAAHFPGAARAQGTAAPAPQGADASAEKLKPEQLEALVAPIALFPDDLLGQALVASTYPLELIQAQQFVAKNPKLKGDELTKAVEKQNWEPSVQATAVMPDLLKRLSEDITWTTNLGNAFLAQQEDVMAAVQRLRQKAKNDGKLTSNDKMKVETQVVEKETVVVIQQANPQVVYVPTYNPTAVWGPPPPYYPYPPVYYPPPPPPGAMLFTFGVGMMWGAAIANGPCCSCGWGHGGGNTVVINNNNNFVNNYNRQNNVNVSNKQSNWQHNSGHRGGAPYGDKATASKYGGNSRGGGGSAGRGPSASTMDRGGGAGGSRGPSASSMDRGGAGGASRGPSASSMDRGGGQIGNQSVKASSGGSAFGGSGGGASRAQASSTRGASSMQARPSGGGGGSRGGGGGGRGGGGRR